ncbi:MAG: DegT/DnrJ/EryC1/StrS aminotransferase family protein [Myxococcales bacterium]|nr:DegT/DnrJ/EryC1/StrS aminotransferase family protein [Myxococcales bacterium]
MWRIPYFELSLSDEEKRAVADVLESGWLAMGPNVAALEQDFGRLLGDGSSEFAAVALSSCTAALHLAMLALDVGPGDEVICPSLTFVADANAIRTAGATVVFADVCSPHELTLDPEDVARKLTARTKAVVVVHYGGYGARTDELLELCRAHGLALIEDACHGPLARDDQGRMLGTQGDVSCYSFYSNKNMTTGEGGMLVSRHQEIAARARRLRSHGMTTTTHDRFRTHAFGYDVAEVGFNYRMDELRAAIGRVQLGRVPHFSARRRQLVLRYRSALAEVRGLEIPFANHDGDHGFHVMAVLLPRAGPSRPAVMQKMAERGVQTSYHYQPIHSFTAYREEGVTLPVTDAVAPRLLSLPLYPTMTDEQVDDVVRTLTESLAPC